VDLERVSDGGSCPSGLSVTRVEDAEAVHAWHYVGAAGFELPDLMIDPLVQGVARRR